MINTTTKYGFSDIVMLPAETSLINSRSECDILDENGMLPLITAPMFSVIDDRNEHLFVNDRIYVARPRNPEKIRLFSTCPFKYVSYSLDEFQAVIDLHDKLPEKVYCLIDIANGHMQKLINVIEQAKNKFGDSLYLMVGNIALPETFYKLSIAGADAVRCGIGSGQACFDGDTMVITREGNKKIKDVCIDDQVLTHDGSFQSVIAKSERIESEEMILINETISTKEHKYYVLHSRFSDIVTDENIHEYAQWMEAKDITPEYLLIDVV